MVLPPHCHISLPCGLLPMGTKQNSWPRQSPFVSSFYRQLLSSWLAKDFKLAFILCNKTRNVVHLGLCPAFCPGAGERSVVGTAGGQAVGKGRKAAHQTLISLYATLSCLSSLFHAHISERPITTLLFPSLQQFHSFCCSFFST